MPFDGRSPSRAVAILSRMEEAFRSGEWKWTQEGEDCEQDGQCLVTGLNKIATPLERVEVEELLYRAIPGRKSTSRQSAIMRYNDRKGCTLEHILAIISKAKTLVQKSV